MGWGNIYCMKISLIVALATNHCIGLNNQLPWRQSADLQHFKTTTMGKPILMGRKTYESIGRPLPGRHNIIITRNTHYHVEGCDIQHSLEAAIAACQDQDEIMITGGGQLFEQAMPLVERMYLTWIHTNIDGDAFFPSWQAEQWQEVSRQSYNADEKNQFDYSFVVLERM